MFLEKRRENHLKESGEHVEGVYSRGTVRIRQHLVDMATPRVLLVVIGDGLERCQDSREEGRRGRRGLDLWEAVCVTVILTGTHGGANKLQPDMSHAGLRRKQTHASPHASSVNNPGCGPASLQRRSRSNNSFYCSALV